MLLTPRRRAFLAVVLSWPLGAAYLYPAVHLARALARDSLGGRVECSDGPLRMLDRFNGCGPGFPGLAVPPFHAGYVCLELVVLTAVVVAVAYGVARWVTWPLRQIADTISRFGPTSLGLRLRAAVRATRRAGSARRWTRCSTGSRKGTRRSAGSRPTRRTSCGRRWPPSGR